MPHLPLPDTISPGAYKAFEPPASWRDYGACWLYDELYLQVSNHESAWDDIPINRIVYNKKLRILTSNGTSYGNIEVPVLRAAPDSFDVTLSDSTGRRLPLDLDALKREYLDKGVVVVPNVAPGSDIGVYIAYTTYTLIPYQEFHFSKDIPVVESKFTFSSLSKFDYDVRDYNLTTEPVVVQRRSDTDEYTDRIYTQRALLPPPRLDYQATAERTERWTAVVLRRAFDFPVITDWYKIAEGYRRFVLPPSPSSQRKMNALTADISQKKINKFELADSLLQWTAENIVNDESASQHVVPDRIIERQKGTVWDIAGLLWTMLRKVGIPADIVLCRIRSLGGFDKNFAAPLPAGVPLVVATIDQRRIVAFPYSRGGRLGEFPAEFTGQYGLSLMNFKPVPLPSSRSGPAKSATVFTFECGTNHPLRQTVDFTLYGTYAYETRVFLKSIDADKYAEFFQRWLTGLGTSNAIDSFKIDGVERFGGPLTVHASFSNPNQMITRGSTRQILFSNIFDQYLKSYDTLRTEDVVTTRCIEDTEAVRLITPGATATPNFFCDKCSNILFSFSCEQTSSGDTLFFRRVIRVDSTTLDAAQMKRVYPDLIRLNRIRESSVSIIKKTAASSGTRR